MIDRIDCVGITHWSLWENGKRSVDELIKINPSLHYLKDDHKLYPIRLEQGSCMSLDRYLDNLLDKNGKSGLILAQGGMGKTTLLLHTAMLQGKRYSLTEPAVFYISLHGWDGTDTNYIRSQILMRLKFKKEENTFETAMHSLHQLLGQTIQTKHEEKPIVLLLLDGLNEARGDIGPLVQEIRELNAMAGVRILSASRSEIPELGLETARLLPLDAEDIEDALGRNGLLIPKHQDILQLLRTPLILSLYLQASEGGKQLDIQNEDELMKAYISALLEKEIRELPEDSPQRWQIDVALNYVLPAIAIESKRKNTALTQEQLLRTVARCWKTLNTRSFRKVYPQWIGHSAEIHAGAGTPEEWLGIMIHSLLWKRLGMLAKDTSGGYRIFHQTVAEHLAGYKIPIVKQAKWIVGLTVFLLCATLVVGYQQYWQKKAAEASIRDALELGAAGYVEYGRIYEQLRNLTNYAIDGDDTSFQMYYGRVLEELHEEQERTKTENEDIKLAAKSSVHDQLRLNRGEENVVYEYSILSDLLIYPDERAAFYCEQLPLLKSWIESETLREKTSEFGDSLLTLLEADADLAAETYHIAVGIHLPVGVEREIGVENIHDAVALVDELDDHRKKESEEDRSSRLSSLNTKYLDAKLKFENERSTLERYIKNLASTMQMETMDLQIQLAQISERRKADNQLMESASIDAIITQLDERQKIEQDLADFIENFLSGR